MNTPILIVAHQPLASAYLEVVRHVLGSDTEHLLTLDIEPDADSEQMTRKGVEQLTSFPQSNGSIVLTDCLGASPSNIGQAIAESVTGCYFVAGINLPMLLRVLNYSGEDAASIVNIAIKGGKNAIVSPQQD